jgi:hypothetical protein
MINDLSTLHYTTYNIKKFIYIYYLLRMGQELAVLRWRLINRQRKAGAAGALNLKSDFSRSRQRFRTRSR